MRKRLKLTILGFFAVSGLFVILVVHPIAYIDSEWEVDVGQIITMNVIQFDSTSGDLDEIENLEFWLNVTDIPPALGFYSADSFISDIIGNSKCICLFKNGTPFSGRLEFLNLFFSQLLLPNNAWLSIDYLFPDIAPSNIFNLNSESVTWIARLDDGLFFFSRDSSGYHGGSTSSVWYNMTTGLPVRFSYSSSHFWGDGSNPYTNFEIITLFQS